MLAFAEQVAERKFPSQEVGSHRRPQKDAKSSFGRTDSPFESRSRRLDFAPDRQPAAGKVHWKAARAIIITKIPAMRPMFVRCSSP
jgi:hypothetical protein